ncbi:MAG: hypothetical protein ACR2FX_01425 [Chthoniobacterales bacterium]
MAGNSSPRPHLQRGPIFQFFASLKLAVVLLSVLIIASITGTIYESSFDAKVARTYIYGAPWFNLWLVLLGANLAVSALSRWPWRKHHVAFLITHLGIITLLTGSLIGRIWGIEGTITLLKGEPPANRLLVDEHQLRVHDADGIIKGYRAEFLHHPPTPEHPRNLGPLANGARLSVVNYASAIEAKLNPRPLDTGGTSALHFNITTAMMGQHLESWLLADDPQHGSFSMGLATIEFKRGKAPPSDANVAAPGAMTEIEESIFAFAKSPEQVGHVAKGGSSGAKVTLSQPAGGDKGRLTISLGQQTQTLDVASNLAKSVRIDGTELTARVDNYWPDFRMQNGRPVSVSETPNNPAVMVTISGRGIPAPEVKHAAPAFGAANASAPSEDGTQNHLTIFIGDDGALSYELKSRKSGESSGALELNKPLVTGWADWQLVVDRTMPHAQQWMEFTPAPAESKELPDGVRVRFEQNGQRVEQWVPSGWQIAIPAEPQPIPVSYGFRSIPLPIGLELLDFEVARNEGSDAPAGFKSTLRVSTAEGDAATGQCWMNHPYNFPGAWWRAWTGLTFKMSQASWNPQNLSESTIQILRDPGWSLKWIGSLLIVTGVFLMFYVKRFRRPAGQGKTTRREARPAEVMAA